MGLHWQELVILLILALVVFGPRKLPEIGRSLGKGMREFKQSIKGETSELRETIDVIEAEVDKRPDADTARS